MLRRGLIYLLFFLVVQPFIAQELPNDRARFVKDFDRMIRQSTSENLRSFTRDQLGNMLLETSDFPEEYFQRMVETANTMMERRLKPHPEVYNYVFSVYTLVDQKQSKESYEAWHNTVDRFLAGRNIKRFTDFIDISGEFFSRNVIAKNPNFEWVCSGGEYNFSYDEKDGAFIEFQNSKLVCRTINRNRSRKEAPYSDSLLIYNTSGIYELTRQRYTGQNGMLTWEKAGYSIEETHADLTDYQISMRSTNFTCDTVYLKSPYFEEKIAGKLIDRAQRGSAVEDRELPFPQFQSFERKYTIKNFIPNVDYLGGFSLQGSDFVGEGTVQEPARLTFYKSGKTFVSTTSNMVRVADNKLLSDNCGIRMYIGRNDSIIHPSLSLTFVIDDEELQLFRRNTGLSQAPFVNSYHKLDMYVEQIVWNRKGDELDLNFNFATSQQQRKAHFESFDFYDEYLFQKVQGMASTNPLTALWNYAYKYDEFVMSEGTASTALGQTIQQAKSKLLDLSALGFISYDSERGIVVINNKLEHFVKSKSGKKDFDNVAFVSDLSPQRMEGKSDEEINKNPDLRLQKELMDRRNAERARIKSFGKINLTSLDLDLVAVSQVPISEGKRTVIFPTGDSVQVRENRNIFFKGWVNSGKWEVQILSGNYDYSQNKFNIIESDAALFRAVPWKPEHGPREIPIQSTISGVRGELFVDALENRSGQNEEFDDYPKLNIKEKTRVYYDHRSIHKGAYSKDRFFFEIEPFEVDSLSTFNEKYLRLPGELTSAGIFPKFKQELKIMPDYSLGFSTAAPEDGYTFYGSNATYENQIVLSNQGLQGNGSIDFMNSTSVSRLFTFLPDSTIGVAEFTNRPQEEGVEFPDAYGPDAFITYLPKRKTLKARSNKQLISFYDGEAKLRGETVIRENGMRGKGIIRLEQGANLTSNNYRFGHHIVHSDTTVFNLTNKYVDPEDMDEEQIAVKTDNMKSYVDFKERYGEFKSNDGSSKVEFPVNKYYCKIDMFKWFMDTEEIELQQSDDDLTESDRDLDLAGPNFVSTHPKQDSLAFRSGNAKYSLKEKTIYCSSVDYIDVADARISPDSAKVTIRKNAVMETLHNSTIVANYITKYHKIEKATTNITARRAYTSKGEYPYYDSDSNKYIIYFPRIYLDTSYQTNASGKISQDDDFKISSRFDFYGDVILKAADPFLTFKGATRINHDCNKFDRNWMAFTAPIDPNNVQIPVSDEMKDLDGNPISAGIVWRHSMDTEEIELYPTFLSSLIDPNDPIVITASGLLTYSDSKNEFQISTAEKLINRNEAGNYVSLHTKSCSMNGDGKVSLGMDYGNIEVDAVGVVNYNQSTEVTTMNLTLKISAPVDKRSFENLAKSIVEIEGIKPLDFSSTTLEQAILEWTDRETADKIRSDFTLEKRVRRVPREMQEFMVITGVKLTSYSMFGEEQIGLKTTENKAALVNMFGEPVMRVVPFKLFAQQRTATGDRLGFMFDVPGAYSYFIDYDYRKSGTMNILTNDKELFERINSIKPDKRKERKFMYQMTENSAYQNQFLRVFN